MLAFYAELAKENLIEIPLHVNGKLGGHVKTALGKCKGELEKVRLRTNG